MKKTIVILIAASVGLVAETHALWGFAGSENACFTALFKHPPEMVFIGLVVCLGIGGFGALLGLQQLRSYGAALIATTAILPGVAALVTVIIFLAPWTLPYEGKYAPFWGTGIALLIWVVVALFSLRFTDAKYAIPSCYAELCQRFTPLKSLHSEKDPPDDPRKCTAFNQVRTQIEESDKEFEQKGLSWALARGYINAWNRLHRAEEAMIEVAPQETVIAGALNDVLRLQGSKIDHSDDLIARVRQAIDVIDPSAQKYLQGAAATPLPLVITTPSPLEDGYQSKPYSQTLAVSGGTPPVHWSPSQSLLPEGLELREDGVLNGTPAKNGTTSFTVRATDSANVTATKAFTLTIAAQPDPVAAALKKLTVPDAALTAGAAATGGDSDQKAQALAVLRDVRCTINAYRDERWNGLVVARNRLIGTMMFTGMTAYALLAIAIIMGAQKTSIAAAAAFYLVGATIGLLNQLRSVSQSDSAVEDYGLYTARLIAMPLFCGLAAIGGVVLMALPQMSGNIPPLAITTPSQLDTGVYDKIYYQRIDAAGGTPPYNWLAKGSSLQEGMELKTSGDLIITLPKKPEGTQKREPIKFTAQVKDSTGATVDKYFFLNISSSAKATAEKQQLAKVASFPSTIVRPLEDIFDLHKNIIGLLLAAVFGLTPGLLFDRLQQQAEKYKSDIKSSEATQATPPPK